MAMFAILAAWVGVRASFWEIPFALPPSGGLFAKARTDALEEAPGSDPDGVSQADTFQQLHAELVGARGDAVASGSAVQGNPLTAVAWLANTLGEHGILFKAGEVILSGSLAPLITVVAGDEMSLEIEGAGSCSCRFV